MFQVLPFARVNQGIAFAKILEMLKKMRKVLSKPCTYHFSLQTKTWQSKLYFSVGALNPHRSHFKVISFNFRVTVFLPIALRPLDV